MLFRQIYYINLGGNIMLSIKNVSKKYSNNSIALSNISLELESGIIGFLGEKGAGKSTLIKMIATVLKPSEGIITWNGKDIYKNGDKFRQSLGYLPQKFGVFPNLTIFEFLRYIAALKGLNMKKPTNRINDLIDILNLREVANRSIKSYFYDFYGIMQKIGVVQALLNDPKILMIDEQTIKLDINERINFENLINSLSKDKIIILATHIVSNVDSQVEKIVLMKKGKLICFCKKEELLNSLYGNVWECLLPESDIKKVKGKYITGNITRRSERMLVKIISEIKPSQNAIMVQPTLEDAYIYYTAGKRREYIE